MKDFNFEDLIDSLKKIPEIQVVESVNHSSGVLRKFVFNLYPNTITIEYLEFGRHQTPLDFSVVNENGERISFATVNDFISTLGLDMIENVEPDFVNTQSGK